MEMSLNIDKYLANLAESTYVEKNNYQFTILSCNNFADEFNLNKSGQIEELLMRTALGNSCICKKITSRFRPHLIRRPESLVKLADLLNKLSQKTTNKDRSSVYILHRVPKLGEPEFDYESAYKTLNEAILNKFNKVVRLDNEPDTIENRIFKCILPSNCNIVLEIDKYVKYYDPAKFKTVPKNEDVVTSVQENISVDKLLEMIYNKVEQCVEDEDYNTGFKMYDKLLTSIDKLGELDEKRKVRCHEI